MSLDSSLSIWITREEFCSIYGRTRQWAHTLSLRGDFAEFNIPTMRIVGSYYGRRARWFFLVPRSVLRSSPTRGVK